MRASRISRSGKSGGRRTRKGVTGHSRLKTARQKSRNRHAGSLVSAAYAAAYAAGMADGAALLGSGGALGAREAKLRMNEHWTRRCLNEGRTERMHSNILQEGQAYGDGFAAGLHQPGGMWTPVPMTKAAAAVVVAGSNCRSEAILQLLRLPLQEIIVVLEAGGETEVSRLRALPEITIVHTRERLGADVGRTLGARMTSAELILFVDGEIPVATDSLAAMLAEAQNGSDLVLADLKEQLGDFKNWDDASRIRAFMNYSLGRPELHASSVAVLPHVWSRSAMEGVGLPLLAIPAMAQRAAIQQRLHIRCLPVSSLKKGYTAQGKDGSSISASAKLSAGDHIEALQAIMATRGSRLGLPDYVRRRLETRGRAT